MKSEVMRHYDEALVNGELVQGSGSKLIGRVEISKYTGEVLFSKDIYHNDLLIGGAAYMLEKAYNKRSSFAPSTIDKDLGIVSDIPLDNTTIAGENVIGLVCGIGGAANMIDSVKPVQRHKKNVEDMIPFRTSTVELSNPERAEYFLRSIDNNGMIQYYGKRFMAEPEIKVLYEDGTIVEDSVSSLISPKRIDVYAESQVFISAQDFRDYFIYVDGKTNTCRINTIGLVAGYSYTDTMGNIEFANVRTITALNMENKDLKDFESTIRIVYKQYLI